MRTLRRKQGQPPAAAKGSSLEAFPNQSLAVTCAPVDGNNKGKMQQEGEIRVLCEQYGHGAQPMAPF